MHKLLNTAMNTKTLLFIIYLTLIGVVVESIISCKKIQDTDVEIRKSEVFMTTKASIPEEDYYRVTSEDMDAYVHFLSVLDDPEKREVTGFFPYEEEGELLFYVVTFSDGWRIISPDKRGPVVLCENEVGSFNLQAEENPAMLVWIEGLLNDIDVRRKLDEYGKRQISEQTKKEEENSIHFWRMLRPGEDDIVFPDTKSPRYPPLGHWELVSATYQMELYSQVDHYTNTQWGQGSPYNSFCPPKTNGQGGNKPAGCVAIAGAQLLYYLHGLWGVPLTAPTSLNANNYGQDYTTGAWSLINNNYYTDYLGYFIRDIGTRVGTTYGNDASGAYTANLIPDVFNFYGIDADYDDYDYSGPSSVKASLDQSLPVIMRANGTQHHFLWFTWEDDGHTFLIDGYKVYRREVTGYYEWVWDEPYSSPVPFIENTIIVTYDDPQMLYVKMNWGWNGAFNDVWFTPAGTWEVYDIPSPSDTTFYHFDYGRKFIHNYSIL